LGTKSTKSVTNETVDTRRFVELNIHNRVLEFSSMSRLFTKPSLNLFYGLIIVIIIEKKCGFKIPTDLKKKKKNV